MIIFGFGLVWFGLVLSHINHCRLFNAMSYLSICSRRYFSLARNLIRRLILPNQDDLSYSVRNSFSGQQKLGKLPNTVSLAGQRRPVQTSHWQLFNSSSSMDTWRNLSNLWIPCVYLRPRNPSWIWIRYIQYATTGITVTPKIGYVDAMPLFRSRHLALISPLGHFNGHNAHLSTRHTKLTVTPKFISSNGNMAFAKLRRTQALARYNFSSLNDNNIFYRYKQTNKFIAQNIRLNIYIRYIWFVNIS